MKSSITFLSALFLLATAEGHPMDAGSLQVHVIENRATFELKIHKLAFEQIRAGAGNLFDATLAANTPLLNNETCEWRTPEVYETAEQENNIYLNLKVVAVCNLAKINTGALEINLPFLALTSPAFNMITTVDGLAAEKSNFILNSKTTSVTINAEAYKSQNLFIKLGMAHIGVAYQEWVDNEGHWRWPEGLDHVFFVLALVLTGSGLVQIVKNATGFTVGHTLTLILATYQIVHVHSHWVEALIALTISLLIAIFYIRKSIQHGFLLNFILGTVHGLAFSSVIHDLQLPKEMVLPTLFSFNLGVELGQVSIILLACSFLYGLKKISLRNEKIFRHALALLIFICSSFWFIQRGPLG